jgi:hypothetical protein
MKNSILLIVPDGVGIKNYLYTDVFKKTNHNLILFHNLDRNAILDIQTITNIENEILIPDYQETLIELFLRELICFSRLKFNSKLVKNKSIIKNWTWSKKTGSKFLFYKLIEFASILFNSYSSILKLENIYQKVIRKNIFYKKVKDIFEQNNPKSIFCTHQRGLKMATIFAVAHDLKIPSTTVIYSWDNLPKARLALRSNKYLVWSDYMKNEMKIYYPEINQNNVFVTGSPQFEFYNDKNNIIDKAVFYEKYNLDINKKIICFSGDDELTSPDDPKYLNDIANQLKLKNLDNNFQILFRRCPVDVSGRYDSVIKNHSDLIKIADPLWNFNKNKSWETIYPTFKDVELLVSTVFYSDLVINIGSTMAFDFVMFEKPCIFINYDQEFKTDKNWSSKIIYDLQHFRSMPNQDVVIWVNNQDEIIDKIVKALKFDNKNSMIEWSNTILYDKNNASKNIIQNL